MRALVGYNCRDVKLEALQEKLKPLCVQAGVRRLGVFGSTARGDDGPTSDVDLVVTFREQVSMFDLMALEERMSNLLDRPVDLATDKGLHPLIRDNVSRELRIIYEEQE